MTGEPWRLRGDALAAMGERVALTSRSAANAAQITYAELALRAASVSRQLAQVGVLPGDLCALVSSGRAYDEAIGLAGILTSGAVAMPLDATAPPKRLAAIMKARGCSAIVLDAQASRIADAIDAELANSEGKGEGEGAVATKLARVVLDAEGVVITSEVGSDTGGRAAREAYGPIGSIACFLHTSGSTGVPKPVPITWAGLDAFTSWAIDLISLSPSDCVLRVAELIFDLAWFDHLATLRAGATLVTMSRRDLSAGTALLSQLRALEPSVIYGVPSLFMKLTAALPPGEALPTMLRAVLFAGEVFPPRELLAFARTAPSAELYNLYGPTETNVCTYHHVDRSTLDGVRETPIGVACPYARCRLVTDDEHRIEIEGEGAGELVVEGPTTIGGGPYATRDRVERGADGLFYFRGRIDRMVKIRGYRVEPGEVEAVLGSHPSVRQAAVVVAEDARLGKVLRAHVELRSGEADPGDRALRMFLAERLPSYMVPEKVIVLNELPRTSTGKVNYQSLM